MAARDQANRRDFRLGTRARHGTRPSCLSRHPPRPIPDAPTSCLLPKSGRRAVYCRRSNRHWAYTVPSTTSQNRVMSLIWLQFSPCAYAPQTRPRRHREIAAAGLATPPGLAARAATVVADPAVAGRTDRLAVGLWPSQAQKHVFRALLGHPCDLARAERTGGRGQEEVLSHGKCLDDRNIR